MNIRSRIMKPCWSILIHVDLFPEDILSHLGSTHRANHDELPAPRSRQVIIFDWDDTLLCSSAINAQQWRQDQALFTCGEMCNESILLAYCYCQCSCCSGCCCFANPRIGPVVALEKEEDKLWRKKQHQLYAIPGRLVVHSSNALPEIDGNFPFGSFGTIVILLVIWST